MNILILKTFAVILIMLCASAIAARRNHSFETRLEFWGLFIVGLVLMFAIQMTQMPINLILALIFAGIMGALIGPGIKGMMMNFVVRKRLEAQGYNKERLKGMSDVEKEALTAPIIADIDNPAHSSVVSEWNNVIGLALYGTSAIVFITAAVVYFVGFDFSILGTGLLIALIGLIVFGLLNYFFFKSPLLRLIGSYFGAVIFSLYLLYDFNQLEKAVALNDTSWETAVGLGVSIYLDIINLFLDLLDILSSSS
jgi:FtsH-binding integral membrane protein